MILFGVLSAIVTSVVAFYAKLNLGQALILVFVSEVFLIEITNYVSMRRPKPRRPIQVLRGENKIFKKAIDMQEKTKATIYASWGFPRYTSALEDYYEQAFEQLSKKPEVKIIRVINIREVGKDRVKKHLARYLTMLSDGQYTVYSTFLRAFEYLVIDRKEAIFLAPHAVRGDMDMGIHGKEESFVHCLVELFDDLCERGSELKIPESKNENELKGYIYRWVDSQAAQS